MPQQPQRIGKYEVISVLGEGGMGIVYRGRDPLIDRTVAIKTILVSETMSEDNLLARLRMEAKSAGRLHHPNIVTVFDYGEEGSLSYLVMEYVDGTNLARIIHDAAALPFSRKLDIVIQLCNGLAYAHDCGVLHRDIKPSNICITRNGVPKILDFGLARIDATRLTRTGQVSGTIAYMSPERLRGETGPGDDIFALGALAYEMFTGQSAFPGKSYSDVAVKIISVEPPAPSIVASLPTELDGIIAKAIAKTRAARFQSASDFGRALEEFRTSRPCIDYIEQEAKLVSRDGGADPRPHTGEHPYSAPDMDKPTAQFDPTAATMADASGDMVAIVASQASLSQDSVVPAKTATAPKAPSAPMTAIRFTTDPTFESSRERPAAAAAQPMTEARPSPDFTAVAPARQPEPANESAFLPTEMQAAPFFSSARIPIRGEVPSLTVVAPRPARAASSPADAVVAEEIPVVAPAAEPEKLTGIASIGRLLPFIVGALMIVTVAAGQTGKPLVVLGCYAVSAIAWVLMMYNTRLQSIWWAMGLGIVVRLATLMTPPIAAAASGQAEGSPVAVLLTLGISQGGNSAIVFQLLLLIAELVTIRLLWSKKDPMVAFAYATFPFVVIAGFWDLRIELIAAAMLVGGYTLATREREGWGGLLTGISAGTVPGAVGAIPGLVTSATHDIFMLLVSLGTLFATVKLSPLHHDMASFAEGGKGSPWNFLTTLARTECEQAQIGEKVHSFVAPRISGTVFSTLSPHFEVAPLNRAFGIAVVAVLTYAVLALVARRTRKPEAVMANSFGTSVLVFAPFTPVAWLIVAPFALIARSPLWIYYAAISPILFLRSGNNGRDWILNIAALVLPPLVALSTRRSAPKAEPVKAA